MCRLPAWPEPEPDPNDSGESKEEAMSKVLVLGGSIRAKEDNRDVVLGLANAAGELSDFRDAVRSHLDSGGTLCNSEILAGAALLGARTTGAEVAYFPLCHLFPSVDRKVFDLRTAGAGQEDAAEGMSRLDTLDIDKAALADFETELEKADGIVLSTPVYFGDRSSVANKFLQLASVRQRMAGKAYGVVSVGAKRNGGQETCNIFSLFEMLGQGAFGVGNGMPTSQYGGTAVGGNKGHVVEDEWGLITAMSTGGRVAEVSRLVLAGRAAKAGKAAHILLLVAMDTRDRRLNRYVEGLAAQAKESMPWVDIRIVNLLDTNIYRCLACDKCPRGKDGDGAFTHCVIRDSGDFLETVRDALNASDGFIVCGFNPEDIGTLITRYQVVTERLRFMRRNNYELSNRLVAGLCFHQFGATINPIHTLKVMVSYIRHNTVMHRPIEIFEYKGTILDSGQDQVNAFCEAAATLAMGRRALAPGETIYHPFGEGSGYTEQDNS
jgi:multimeric flavodoxin WrbA